MCNITRVVYCLYGWLFVGDFGLRSDEVKWSLVASLSICSIVVLAESESKLQRAVNDNFKQNYIVPGSPHIGSGC